MARANQSGSFIRSIALLLLLAALMAGFAWKHLQEFAAQPLDLPSGKTTLVIDPGDHFGEVLGKLRAAGVSDGLDLEWKALAMSMRVASRLQAGEYELAGAPTPRSVLLMLARGEVVRYRFTLVEGWNIRDLRKALSAEPNLAHDSAALDDAALMEKLDRRGVAAEGRFLPETYFFTRGSSDLDLLDRAAKAMDKELAEAWTSHEEGLPLDSPDELLTLASIVEKETGQASERPQIAGVFVHRLKLGMRLQTDPTIIYGMGSAYDGNIRKTDLETDTPYNPYTRAGLPPTPISMPGKAAIEAAAHPAKGDALYFVARGNGAHVFSATLDKHNANVRKYQLKH